MNNVEINHDYLLLLEAGKQQRQTPGLLPAWDRYDTRIFKDLRVWRDNGRVLPQVLILSPLHDLIEPTQPIEAYDPDEIKMESDVADMIAADPDNRELFRRHFTRAKRVLCVTDKKANRIFQRWLQGDEHYDYEGRGLHLKREIMRHFLEEVPQRLAA